MEDWIKNVDDKWVRINIDEINSVFNSGHYEWDAQGFGGILSFAELFISLVKKEAIPSDKLDLSFLQNSTILDQLIYSLNDMLTNTRLQENVGGLWDEWEIDIKRYLLDLKEIKLLF